MGSVDDQLDRLLQQLQDTGELGSTLIIVTSDNGYHWGEQSWFTKFVPYEPSVRIPLLLRWDGHVAPGDVNRLTSNIDILPTVLGILGRTPPKPLDGTSLLSPTARTELLAEYFLDTASNGPEPTWASLTTSTRKYIETRTRKADGTTTVFKELYRLDTDPGELVNILKDGTTANDPTPASLTSWANRLAAARGCAGSGCP